MKRNYILFLLVTMCIVGLVGTSYAEVKLSGEFRLRGVMVDNSEATTEPNDGGFWEQRTRLNAEASMDETAKIFIQVQDSRKWGDEASTATTGDDTQALDLSQGYLEIGKLLDQPLSVRLGRQAMAYGEHRLVGSFEWSNNARRFDALKFMYRHDIVDVDVWTAKLSETSEDWGNDDNFNGIYASLKNVPRNAVDLYLLQKITNAGTTASPEDGNFYTLGARVKGGVENIKVDYTAEVAKQTGDASADVDKDALAYAIRVGYTLPNVMGLRVGVEYAAATGDDDPTDDEDKAFDNLYPTNHYLYGFTDDIGWTNIQAWSLNAGIKPLDKLILAVEYWNYTAAEEDASGNDDMGTETNVKANYELSKNINCEAAYVIRDAGDIATPSYGGFGTIPADESSTFGYFMINMKFM